MLTVSGVKLVDFGVAAVVGERADDSPDRIVLGTPAYLAPERVAAGVVTPATDVCAVGLLLYQTLTGSRRLLTDKLGATVPYGSLRSPRPTPTRRWSTRSGHPGEEVGRSQPVPTRPAAAEFPQRYPHVYTR